jgi:hypothetical protein
VTAPEAADCGEAVVGAFRGAGSGTTAGPGAIPAPPLACSLGPGCRRRAAGLRPRDPPVVCLGRCPPWPPARPSVGSPAWGEEVVDRCVAGVEAVGEGGGVDAVGESAGVDAGREDGGVGAVARAAGVAALDDPTVDSNPGASVWGVVSGAPEVVPADATLTAEPDPAATANPVASTTRWRRTEPTDRRRLRRARTVVRHRSGAGRASATRSVAVSVKSACGYSTNSSGTANEARQSRPLPESRRARLMRCGQVASAGCDVSRCPRCTTSIAPAGAPSPPARPASSLTTARALSDAT